MIARDGSGRFVSEAEREYIRARAREAAKKTGMIDPTDVDHLDLGSLEVQPDGTIPNLEAKIAAIRSSKPHFFKQEPQQARFDPDTIETELANMAGRAENERIAKFLETKPNAEQVLAFIERGGME